MSLITNVFHIKNMKLSFAINRHTTTHIVGIFTLNRYSILDTELPNGVETLGMLLIGFHIV